jgi:hypothetical protein
MEIIGKEWGLNLGDGSKSIATEAKQQHPLNATCVSL